MLNLRANNKELVRTKSIIANLYLHVLDLTFLVMLEHVCMYQTGYNSNQPKVL